MALVMYDLDGTLVDTASELTQAVNLTLRDFGLDGVSEIEVRSWIGCGTGHLMREAWLTKQPALLTSWDNVMRHFSRHYAACINTGCVFFPYVEETLHKARDLGIKQAVITNKEMRFTEQILERHGLAQLFDLVIGGDSLKVKKPDAGVIHHCLQVLRETPASSLFVGDSEIDIATAKNAGITCWAVPYGYNQGRHIAEAEPDCLVQDIRGVPDYFSQIVQS